MIRAVNFFHKHKSHVDSFITGFIADLIISVTPYVMYFIDISDEQIIDVSFWSMIGSGVFFAIVRAFIKQVGQTILIEMKNFIKYNK